MSRRSLAGDFARGAAELESLWPPRFRDPDAWAGSLARARGPGFHPAAAEALRRQNPADTAARRANLAAVGEPDTVAVVAGQQPGLFLGPLHAVLKAATAISLARRLERERGARCVPIFWVQAEDHDFDEVAAHEWLNARGRLSRFVLPGARETRASLASRALGAGVTEGLDAIARDLAPAPYGDRVTSALSRHYRPKRGIAEAFAGLIAEVFADDGLLALQPRTAELAAAAAPIHERCVDDAAAIETNLRERALELERAGYRCQVPVRPGVALSFFHPDGADGPRHRLVPDDGHVGLAGDERTLSREAVAVAVREDPRCFSTSALLRPLVQDTLVPTVAYVAGPSELAYFAQLPPLYAHFGRAMPITAPRLHLRWLDPDSARALGDHPRDDDALADDGPLARALAGAAGGFDAGALEERLRAAVARELEAARPALEALDPNLGKTCDRAGDGAGRAFDKLVRKATRAALQRAPEGRDRLAALRDLVVPRGQPQERVLGWTTVAARVGPDRLREALLSLDPLAPAGRPHELVL